MRISYRLRFLKSISKNFYSFIRLASAFILYSASVRVRAVKRILLSRDVPFMVDVILFDQELKLKLRMQDIAIFFEIFQEEAYSLPNSPQAGANTIDLGAHIGFASLYFFLKYKLQGIFVLVEPSLKNYELLVFNTQIIKNKSPLNVAISDESGSLNFTDENQFGHNHHASETGTAIPCLSMDDLFKQENIDYCDLLKMDVEGQEKSILMKADISRWRDQVGVVVLEMHFDNEEFEILVSLKGFDFKQLDQKMYALERAS